MADTDADDGEVAPTASGPAAAQLLRLVSGSFASAFDVAAASVVINRREEHWLKVRGIEDPMTLAALQTRSAHTQRYADHLLHSFARSSAAPVPEKEAVTISGRITENAAPREAAEVVALDPQGHVIKQVTTGPGGAFSIRLDKEAKVVLMVTDAHGKRLLVDEQVIDGKLGETAFRELDLAAKGPAKRERADLGDRVTMTDVSGMNVKEAADELRKQGFSDVEVTLEAKRDADGVVISTDPQPGNLVDLSRHVELTVGKDPDARFDRNLVASVVKVETGDEVPDAAVDKMFDALAASGATGLDRLRSAARRDDRSFAELSGLPAAKAATARKSLLKAMNALGTLRDKKG
jgi:hypothetical protein